MMTTEVNGRVLAVPGAGYVQSGLSVRVVMASNELFQRAHQLEQTLRREAEQIARSLEHQTGRRLERLELRLEPDPDTGGWRVIEEQANARITVNLGGEAPSPADRAVATSR
jgi:hypothetical protein